MDEHMSILESDLSTIEYKWEQGDFHSCEVYDLGRHNIIYEIIILCDIGKLSKDFTYYKILYEGDLECGYNPFGDIVDDFVRVQPTMKLTKVYEEVK